VITIRQYTGLDEKSPFGEWLDDLDDPAAARVLTAMARIEQGNFSSVKGVGGGVFESRIDFGPGLRVYFGKDGAAIVILLGGGTKKRQGPRHRRRAGVLAGLQTTKVSQDHAADKRLQRDCASALDPVARVSKGRAAGSRRRPARR
jgi:putative addiction module killer protein